MACQGRRNRWGWGAAAQPIFQNHSSESSEDPSVEHEVVDDVGFQLPRPKFWCLSLGLSDSGDPVRQAQMMKLIRRPWLLTRMLPILTSKPKKYIYLTKRPHWRQALIYDHFRNSQTVCFRSRETPCFRDKETTIGRRRWSGPSSLDDVASFPGSQWCWLECFRFSP